MSGPPHRPHQPYPATSPYAAPVQPVPAPQQGAGPYPTLPPLPPVGPRPWTPVKMLLVVWGSTTLAGPFAGAGFGALVAVVFSYLFRDAAQGQAGAEVFDLLLGTSVTLAILIGGMLGGVVGFGTGLLGAAAAALLFTRLPPVLTAVVSGVAAGGSILLSWVLLASGEGTALTTGLVLSVAPVAVVVVVVFLIVWLAARRARRAPAPAEVPAPIA